jgi:hypothetical protein
MAPSFANSSLRGYRPAAVCGRGFLDAAHQADGENEAPEIFGMGSFDEEFGGTLG